MITTCQRVKSGLCVMIVCVVAGCGGGAHSSRQVVRDDRSPWCDSGGRLVEGHVPGEPERPYLLSAPTSGGRGKPLVVALHGTGGSPGEMEAKTRLAARGVADGVTVVLPSALGPSWHNFSTYDKPYLDAVVDTALRRTCADSRAVVLTGFSNGGDEAQTMGCVEAKRWRAVVVVSSSTVPDFCVKGGRPVTLLRVHGLEDQVSPFTGRTGSDPRDPVLPATARWAAYDGCRARPVVHGTSRRWLGCDAGTSVELIALPGQGHSWPTSPDLTQLVLDLVRAGHVAAAG